MDKDVQLNIKDNCIFIIIILVLIVGLICLIFDNRKTKRILKKIQEFKKKKIEEKDNEEELIEVSNN